MLAPQNSSQVRNTLLRARGGEKLIWVGSPFVGNRNRFSTPDQLSATTAKPLPSPNGLLRRCPIRSRVPALHRLHRDAVADFEWTAVQLPPQRRFSSGHNLGIARNLQAKTLHVALKACNILQAPQPEDCSSSIAHAALRRPGRAKTATQ